MTLYKKLTDALKLYEFDEFGLIPMAPDINELPPKSRQYHPLVVIEKKLGLDFSCLTKLFKEAHEYFIKLNKHQQKELEEVTRVMILLKPDNYTAMNRRKDMLLSGFIDPRAELALIELIFTVPRHSKSSVAWYHRQWLYTRLQHKVTMDIRKEIDLCKATAEAYRRNYYSWTYRIWVMSKDRISDQMVKEEYDGTCQWLTRNVSDYSAFQYLQHIMTLYGNLDREAHTNWLNQLIIKYPNHESLWYHKRFCSNMFIDSSDYCNRQKQFAVDMMQDRYTEQSLSKTSNEVTEQRIYADRFKTWLVYLEGRHHGTSSVISLKPDVNPAFDCSS